MLAYHSDPELKALMVSEMRLHREAERLVKGEYDNGKEPDEWKGCAVGCAIRSLRLKKGVDISYDSHAELADYLGIPQELIRLEDRIFESLKSSIATSWPERFLAAPNPGSDLTMVWPQLALWILRDSEFLTVTDKNREAIKGVIALYIEWCDSGISPNKNRWETSAAASYAASYAASAAAHAAAYAAHAAAYAADAASYAASAAAYAAAYAASAAAYAASAAASAAKHFAWQKIADKLISLMESAS